MVRIADLRSAEGRSSLPRGIHLFKSITKEESDQMNIKEIMQKKQELETQSEKILNEIDKLTIEKKKTLASLYEAVFTPEVMDILAPTHERTSCSDENPANERDCSRCALLAANRLYN